MPTEKQIATLVEAAKALVSIPEEIWSRNLHTGRKHLAAALIPFMPIELEAGQLWVRPGFVDQAKFYSIRILALHERSVFVEGTTSDQIKCFGCYVDMLQERLIQQGWELKETANDQRTADTPSF